MLNYIIFIIRCAKKRFKFFKYKTEKKARIFERNRLYFAAGILYYKLSHYTLAAQCFTKSKSYRNAIKCYEKQGLYSEAIQLAEIKRYYRLGASLCEKIKSEKKAAYFYSFFNLPLATKMYSKNNHFYEAGNCYIKQYKFIKAIECFYKCTDNDLKVLGLRQIEETAITLYFVKEYAAAFELFMKLHDYFSALKCAEKLEQYEVIKELHLLLAYEECQYQRYLSAAKYAKPFDKEMAVLYYYMGKAKEEAIQFLNHIRFSA